ncbi:uncharacterized protein J3R85_013661 [Psidium guajava]|nr:uncharacterized protein J3R85_013661 [Psidium guajava]
MCDTLIYCKFRWSSNGLVHPSRIYVRLCLCLAVVKMLCNGTCMRYSNN